MKFGHYQVVMILMAALVLLYGAAVTNGRSTKDIAFDVNYHITWADHHAFFTNQRTQLQLSMDQSSGAGFGSRLSYGSGFFHMRIKIPGRDSAGVVTAYYLTTSTGTLHNELDFEFLGNREGKPIILQTNVFANGQGNREQRIHLWFDPSADFHTYKIMWNKYQIVFYVDNTPIRVFKNCTNLGVGYPAEPMRITGSLWNGDWATGGGMEKINWAYSPFLADFQDFSIGGCPIRENTNNFQACYSSKYWWNEEKYRKLGKRKQKELEQVRQKYMVYDYCTDTPRHPVLPPECNANAQLAL